MKIAIVHDELVRRGGAEQVTYLLHKAFPDAPLYTSCYNPKSTYSEFKECTIHTTWLNHFINNETNLKRFFFPFSFWAMHNLNLNDFDLVFISTTTYAKFVHPRKDALVIAFCHYPFRLAWFPDSYSQYTQSRGIKRKVFDAFITNLRKTDFKAARQINWFITNTPKIKQIIESCYCPRNEVNVIPASIACDNFHVDTNPTNNYYLVVSRIEPYKKVDLVIETFNQLSDKKLIVVGKGSQKSYCQQIANQNISFKEGLSKEEIADLYANCKALIFPQKEDYGLTPLEANASGRPVIAFGEGGVTFTMIPYVHEASKATVLFFKEQSVDSLSNAIQLFETLHFDSQFIRKHAEKFDEKFFIEKICNFVNEKWKDHNRKLP